MGIIFAIGGGEMGARPGTVLQTFELDQELVKLSCKRHPKLLFVPTASSDAESYCSFISKYFGSRHNCDVDVLYLFNNQQTARDIERKILTSDIVYVGGGNTLKMLIEWRKRGVDKAMLKAYETGIILSGISAGAICWFKYSSSDSRRFNNPKAELIKIRGLNIIKALCCPHFDDVERQAHVKALVSKTPGVAVALDNCCAIEIVENRFRIITSNSQASAYKLYWRRGQYHREVIPQIKVFQPLDRLLVK